MAKSGTIYGTKDIDGVNYLYMTWQEVNVNAADNTSDVIVMLYLSNGYGKAEASRAWAMNIGDESASGTKTNWQGNPVLIGMTTKTITHDADGKKTLNLSGSFGTGDGAWTVSGTAELTEIPAPLAVSQETEETGADYIKMSWEANAEVDSVWYSTDGGTSWVMVKTTPSTEGEYTISRLKSDKTYKVKTKVRRKGTKETAESTAANVTTLAVPSVTLTVASLGSTEVSLNWQADSPIDHYWVTVRHIDGSASPFTWDAEVPYGDTSGWFTYGFGFNTDAHGIKIKVRHRDSQQTSESQEVIVKPLNTKSVRFTTLSDVPGGKTTTSVKLEAAVSGNDGSPITGTYIVEWEGKGEDGSGFTGQSILKDSTSVIKEFTGLNPGTFYWVTASLYQGDPNDPTTKYRPTPILMRHISTSTYGLGGTFKATARSASVIWLSLSGMRAVNLPLRVNFYMLDNTAYGLSDGKTEKWDPIKTFDLLTGETKDLTHMLSALMPGSSYNFKAEVYRTDTEEPVLMKTYAHRTSTFRTGSSIIPCIEDYVVIPHVAIFAFKAGLSEPLTSGLQLKLYSSSDGTAWVYASTVSEDLYGDIAGTIGSTMYYKLEVMDGNGNIYGMSDSLKITYPDLLWTPKTQGTAIDLTAAETRDLADALIALYKVFGLAGATITTQMEAAYAGIQSLLKGITRGEIIKSEPLMGIYNLAAAFLEETNVPEEIEAITEPGAIITATALNMIAEDVESALEVAQQEVMK